jgi:exopolysaccharide production protein ExoQ
MSTLSMGTAVQPALAPPAELGNGGSRLFTAIIVVITLFAFMEPIEYAWYRPTYDESDDDERADAGARDGSVQRQITLGALGLIGAATIALSKGKEMRLRNLLGILCVVYLAWCAASILWSDELSMTLRRQIALGCEIVAGVAIATRASPRQFAWIVFACTVTWLGLGILAEVTQGALQPWLTGYRFKGIFHANIMSANCALLVLSSLYLSGGGGKSKKQILYAIAGIAFVFLVLTGSRTALGAVIASIAAVFFATTTPSKRIVSLGLAGLALVFFVAAGGIEAFNLSSNSVSLGRQDNDPASLTGRLPLWSELVGNYVRQRPFAGFGYGAFWSPGHIAAVERTQGWNAPYAHCTYIDLVLSVGLIGAMLFVLAMIVAFVRASRLETQKAYAGYGFVAMVIACVLADGTMETTFGATLFMSFFGICAICFVLVGDQSAPQLAGEIGKH